MSALIGASIDVPKMEARAASKYVLTSSVVLRMTGFPVEAIKSLASPEVARLADKLIVAQARTLAEVRAILSSGAVLSRSLRRKLKQYIVRNGTPLTAIIAPTEIPHELERLNWMIAENATLIQDLSKLYQEEFTRVRTLLYQFVISKPFQEVLSLSSPKLREVTPSNGLPPANRNSHVRQREITWTSYLQRLTTKNETISFFGPTAWGALDPNESLPAAIEIGPHLVKERVVYIERWVCEALAEAMFADPEIRLLLKFQLPDDLVITENSAFLLLSGQSFSISESEREFLRSCEATPRYSKDFPRAETLLEQKLLARLLEVPISTNPFQALQRIVAGWADHPAKIRWQGELAELDRVRDVIQSSVDLEVRAAAIQLMSGKLAQLGVNTQRGEAQGLYASRLPINEDCHLDARKLVLGKPVMDQLLVDAVPWFDLWRDVAGLYTSRLYQDIRERWLALGGKPIPLLKFGNEILKAWALIPKIDQEIQELWRRQLDGREQEHVISLTEQDTAFLRNNLSFRRMKAFDNMAPDLQIMARDEQALQDGDFSLLVAEVHPDFSVWQNCVFMWCPDPEAYARDYAHKGGQGSAIVGARLPPHFSSAHTSLRIYPYVHHWSFVGVPGTEGVTSIRSAETLVSVTDDDVLLLHTDGRVLGSLLHNWYASLCTHRLEFNGSLAHSPRLQMGRVIVQRESWSFEPSNELRQAAKTGGPTAFAALRKLRQDIGLPEKVFVRGSLPNRLTFEKDIKPVFLDFENPLVVEIMCKMITRFNRFSVTEMLPSIEECWLRGPEGHYSSEFRTVILATENSRGNCV